MARPSLHLSPVANGRSRTGVVAAAAALTAGIGFGLAARAPGTHGGDQHLDLAGVALIMAGAAPLLWWRRAPTLVFVTTATAAAATAALDYPLGFPIGATAALYLLASSRADDEPWRPMTTALPIGMLAVYLAAATIGRRSLPGIELSHATLAWAVAWFAGERTRLRHQYLAELRDRADRAEFDAERDRQLAVAEERARIARDLHDSAGHAVNVIAVHAGAGRLRHDNDPDRAQHALAAIEQLARDTAADIDHIVGALREPTPTPSTPIGLAALDTLIAQHAAAGLEVTQDVAGMPGPASSATDQAAYRIIQEALTNAARHGTGRAHLTLTHHQTTIEIVVTNPVAAPPGDRGRSGHGIIGMRERARAAGGTLSTQHHGTTFRLSAELPHHPPRP